MTAPASLLIPEDFSVHKGGPVYSAAQRLKLCTHGRSIRLGLVLAGVTWVPLAVLVLVEGSFGEGVTIPFRNSISTHTRLLIAIPLFFFAEDIFDARVPQVLHRLVMNGIIRSGDLSTFANGIKRLTRARDSVLAEISIVALVATLLVTGFRTDLPWGIETWRTSPAGDTTLAGFYYTLVSIPIFQFVFWRWCYRLILWARLLWALSRFDLQLRPTHPDGAAGLSMLGVAHVDLAPVAIAALSVLTSSYAERLLYGGVAPNDLAVPLAAAIVGTTLALIGPLFLFVPKMINAKQEALLEYGTLAAEYTREFADKWLTEKRNPSEHLVGSADIQSLADMGGSFDLIRNMSALPIATNQILYLFIASVLPAVPLVLIVLPLDQLIVDSVRSLLNV